MLRILSAAAGLAVLLTAAAPAQTTVALDNATCPVCNAAQLQAWRALRDDSLGMSAKDKLGHVIGFTSNDDKWFPMADTKQTMCGPLYRFHYVWDGDHDWSFNVRPEASPFTDLFADAYLNHAAGGYPKCDGQNCVHAEINMDQSYPWDDVFKIIPPDWSDVVAEFLAGGTIDLEPDFVTNLIGTRMCVYGPWVRDENHENKPEIHPAEAVWWRQTSLITPGWWPIWIAARETYHIMLLHDDSNRFDRESDYDEILPGFSRPWSADPRREEVRLVIDAKLGGTVVSNYTISERHARHITTSSDAEARQDEGPGTEYLVTYDGITIMRVVENQPDDNLGVRFEPFCRDAENNRVLGVLLLNTKFSEDDRGDEGYHALDIMRTDLREKLLAALDRLRNVTTALPTFPRADSSIQRLLSEIRYVKVIPPRPRPEPVGSLRRRGNELVMDFAAAEGDTGVRYRDVTLFRLGPETVDSLGRKRRGASSLALMPSARAEPARPGRPMPADWPGFLAAAGIPASTGALGEVVATNEWIVRVNARYASRTSEGQIENEPIPLSLALNALLDTARANIRSRNVRVEQVYGRRQPFSVRWTFDAARLSPGGEQRVAVSTIPSRNAVSVDTTGVAGVDRVLRVRFPDAGMYRLNLRGTYTDVFGVTGVVEHVLWSHYIVTPADTSGFSLVRGIAGLVNTSADALVSAARSDPAMPARTPLEERRLRNARFIRAMAMRAASDGRITPLELRDVHRAASRWTRVP